MTLSEMTTPMRPRSAPALVAPAGQRAAEGDRAAT